MSRPTVLFSCNQRVRENYLAPEDIGRLESFAEWSWFDCEGGGIETTNKDPDVIDALQKRLGAISGKRVGLIGCGHMGRRLIKLLKPFGPSAVWVHDPYLARELAEVGEFVQTSLKHILSGCDIVVCLAPLTPRTRRMIGYEELELIRSGCTLVNVSRGPIIDPDALITRLKRGDITAGLDVFDPEPIPSKSEITTLSNVFLSPHIGWYKPDAAKDFFSLMVDDFQRFFSGHETWFDLTPRTRDSRQGS